MFVSLVDSYKCKQPIAGIVQPHHSVILDNVIELVFVLHQNLDQYLLERFAGILV